MLIGPSSLLGKCW